MRRMTGTLRILVASAGACRTVGGESRGARAVAFLTHKQGDLRGKAEPAPSAVLTSVFGEQHHPEGFDVRFGSKADSCTATKSPAQRRITGWLLDHLVS